MIITVISIEDLVLENINLQKISSSHILPVNGKEIAKNKSKTKAKNKKSCISKRQIDTEIFQKKIWKKKCLISINKT